MFVVAFVANVITVFFAARLYRQGRVSLLPLFLMFWALDTIVPLLYQVIVLNAPSPLHLAGLLGFFPALVITLTTCLTYGKPEFATA